MAKDKSITQKLSFYKARRKRGLGDGEIKGLWEAHLKQVEVKKAEEDAKQAELAAQKAEKARRAEEAKQAYEKSKKEKEELAKKAQAEQAPVSASAQ